MQPHIVLIIPTNKVAALLQATSYSTPSLATEGFIHACTAEQVNYVVARFYANEPELTLLFIDPELVKAEVKYESASDEQYGNFPHIFGELNTSAIVAQREYDDSQPIHHP